MTTTNETKQFNVGQKFYYTGDMANSPDWGEIVEVQQPTKYTQLRYFCKFREGRDRIVEHSSFNKSIGQRFKTIEQYNDERNAAMERFYSQFPNLKK